MRALPIILVAAALATACEFPQGTTVPKEEYDAVVNAYNDLKVSAEATRDSYIEQAAAVDNILQELSQISGSTAVLRTDLEQGTARLNQVEMIENSISDIKGKLSQLERLTQDNAQYKKLVSSLRTVIAEKEKEIEDLKAEIQDKDRTINEQNEMISAQHGTIAQQNETINAQQENLSKAVREQARMLFQAGVDFEELGDESPDPRDVREGPPVLFQGAGDGLSGSVGTDCRREGKDGYACPVAVSSAKSFSKMLRRVSGFRMILRSSSSRPALGDSGIQSCR